MSTALPANAVAIQEKTNQLQVAVLSFKIVDRATLEEAGRFSKALAELDKEIHSSFDPIIDSAHSLHKTSIAQRNIHLEPIQKCITHLKDQGRDFMLAEQRRERQEQERQERERIEAERKQREAQAKIELEQRQAEEARLKAQQEADRLLNEAAEKERQAELAKGEEQAKLKAESDALLSKAVEATPAPVNYADTIVPLPPPVQPLRIVPPAIKSVPGLGSRKVWKWRVTNKASIPREYLTVNETILNALTRMSRKPDDIAGIEFYEDLEMRRS